MLLRDKKFTFTFFFLLTNNVYHQRQSLIRFEESTKMATSIEFKDDILRDLDDQQLEIFCIIWLDDNTETSDNRDTEQHLRSIINRLKRFKNL